MTRGIIKSFNSQFAHPEGWMGRLVGVILAWKNRERNGWALSMLDLQPEDQVLEIGFGPGQAIQEVTGLTPKGFAAGIDLSAIMVAQASKRNAVAIRSGHVLLQQGAESPLPFEDARFSQAFCGQFHPVLVKPGRWLARSEACVKTWRPGRDRHPADVGEDRRGGSNCLETRQIRPIPAVSGIGIK